MNRYSKTCLGKEAATKSFKTIMAAMDFIDTERFMDH